MNEERQRPDKTWNTALYDGKNAFVWKHGRGVVELLAPQQGERILDLGCGTGHLTNQIAEAGAEVVGIDKSPAMIDEARRLYPNRRFEIADGTDFHFGQPFDGVFSNAAIHWMKDQASVARCIWEALKPGGRFVAEFGGKGNIRAIRTALVDAVNAVGAEISFEPLARYYPSIGGYATLLEAQGFRVGFASHFDRPTKLDEGERGLRNWLLTFADNIIESLPAIKRETVIAEVELKLRPLLFRDGSWFADYRRIRVVAHREAAAD
ncbi:MAG: methyltransferase domain-containing protein [Acidobacteriota bacterium]